MSTAGSPRRRRRVRHRPVAPCGVGDQVHPAAIDDSQSQRKKHSEVPGEFFERGPKYLQPLVLRDVADDIEAHESTVSQVTSNKYAETPRGFAAQVFLLRKARERAGRRRRQRRGCSTADRGMIKSEDVSKPFGDSQIVKLLKAEGIEIARRTVANYREQLLIPRQKRRIRR